LPASACCCASQGFPIAFGSTTAGDGFGPGDVVRYYAGWTTKIFGETTHPSVVGSLLAYTARQPVGVVGVIMPWNFPRLAVIGIAPALAAGCTVIAKPSELASLSVLALGDIAADAGLPDGALNIITGYGSGAGAALANHPGVDKVFFTGSTSTGKAILRGSVESLKGVVLELGGKSPDIIFADADLDAAVPQAAMGVFGNSGQMCTAGSRLLVERAVYDEVIERLVGVAESLKVGNAVDPDTMIGPIVSEGQLERVCSFLQAGVEQGGEVVTGGSRIVEGDLARGYFVAPTVFANLHDDSRVWREEVFGPVVTVSPFDTIDEAIRRANDTTYGLVSGVWTRHLPTAHRMARSLQAGVVWINTYNAFDPSMPFGGVKLSGIGSQHGPHAMDEYLTTKAVWMCTE
jgi:aldehyde dehydrogenase (NAD+)